MSVALALKPEEIVSAQLQAYNDQDLEAFCGFYARDAVLGAYNGDIQTRGLAAIRERHAKLFAEYPRNRAELVTRMVVGDTVIDRERVTRGPGVEPFDVAAIYTLADGLIARVDFVK